jgi:predicted nuclease with TOPRIM domain
MNDNQQTHINFNSVFHGIKKVIDSKQKLEEMFEKFTDQINSLNSYIDIYSRQLELQNRSDNNSDCSSNQ